jgi:hypothetical protein
LVNELLERRAAKVARSVLRGGWQSDLLSLPDFSIIEPIVLQVRY